MFTKQPDKITWCLDGRCPPGIDEVKEIVLTPLEKKAIFFSLKKRMEKDRSAVEKQERRPQAA